MAGIDMAAPVIARARRRISAPRAKLWRLHVDVAAWPTWQRDVLEAGIEGPFAPGTTFRWRSRGVDEEISSVIREVEPERRTLWGGPAGGVTGLHEWRLQDDAEGTQVETSESWAGKAVETHREQMQAALDASLERWLDYLEQAATFDQ